MRPVLKVEERSKILSAGSRIGISPLSEISDTFVGVFNGLFNLIISGKDPCHTGMSPWSCLPSHSPHLPKAS